MTDLTNKQIFSKNLQYFMNVKGVTRYDVCKALGVPYTTFTDWYKGKIIPRIDKIEKLAEYLDVKKSDLIELKSKTSSIPLLGIVKAGYDLIAQENLLGFVETELKDIEGCFALKVKGDSMQPVLYEDDVVIVHQQPDVESGQIAVVLIGEEATIKKVVKYDDYIELVAFNSYYPPKRLENGFKIIGKVIEARIKKIFE